MSVLALRSPWPSIARSVISAGPVHSSSRHPEPSSTSISQYQYHLSHRTLHSTYLNYPPLPSSIYRHLEETAARSVRCTHFPHGPARPRGNLIRMHSIEYRPSRLSVPWRRRDASRSGNLACVFAYIFTLSRFFNRSREHTEIYPIQFTKITHFPTLLDSVTSMLIGMQPHLLEVFLGLSIELGLHALRRHCSALSPFARPPPQIRT